MPSHCERDNDDEIEITPEMIEVGVRALEDQMLEGGFLESGLRLAVAEAYRAMYRVAIQKRPTL